MHRSSFLIMGTTHWNVVFFSPQECILFTKPYSNVSSIWCANLCAQVHNEWTVVAGRGRGIPPVDKCCNPHHPRCSGQTGRSWRGRRNAWGMRVLHIFTGIRIGPILYISLYHNCCCNCCKCFAFLKQVLNEEVYGLITVLTKMMEDKNDGS